jgi:hypothetical protein
MTDKDMTELTKPPLLQAYSRQCPSSPPSAQQAVCLCDRLWPIPLPPLHSTHLLSGQV